MRCFKCHITITEEGHKCRACRQEYCTNCWNSLRNTLPSTASFHSTVNLCSARCYYAHTGTSDPSKRKSSQYSSSYQFTFEGDKHGQPKGKLP